MDWLLLIFIPCMLYLTQHLSASRRTQRKRRQLRHRAMSAAEIKEYGDVSYDLHQKYCFWLQNPKKLYGPLIQGIWDNYHPVIYDPFWWRCYNEIYLKLDPHHQARIKYVMANSQVGMTTAMAMCHMDLGAWLAQSPPPNDKLTMKDGAEEYEQIMAMQDLING